MWIKNTNPASRQVYDAELMDEPVSFSENGTAQVPSDVGEALIAHYEAIEPHSDNNSDDQT